MNEDELYQRFSAEFAALASRTEAIVLQINPLDAWIIFSQLQLALRHPENTGESAKKVRQIAHQLQELVASEGALAVIAERGWDSQYDEGR